MFLNNTVVSFCLRNMSYRVGSFHPLSFMNFKKMLAFQTNTLWRLWNFLENQKSIAKQTIVNNNNICWKHQAQLCSTSFRGSIWPPVSQFLGEVSDQLSAESISKWATLYTPSFSPVPSSTLKNFWIKVSALHSSYQVCGCAYHLVLKTKQRCS